MKKNVMMRVASVLLIAVLVSTCVISGTYAKYVTAGTGTDSARVAKWGVTVSGTGTTFAEVYETHDGAFAETNSVFASADVVAPGTSKEMAHFTLAGTPEVAVKVNYTADLALSTNWAAGGAYYCPLKITVCGTTLDGSTYASTAEFEEAVEGLIASWSKQYPAGTTDLATKTADDLVVSWEWPFSTSTENDVKDTELGNQAVVGNPATITLTVTCTVTQID